MAIYRLSMTKEFWEDLRRLPPAVYRRALEAGARMWEDPWAKELHPEKVKRAQEQDIYSSRVDQSYRIIWKHVKHTEVVLLLVDKHDEAYRRAARKRFILEGGVVKVVDTEYIRPAEVPEPAGGLFGWFRRQKAGALFMRYTDQDLLDMGVPREALPHIRSLEHEDDLPLVEKLLPEEVYFRLLDILTQPELPTVSDSALRESLERHQGGEDLYRFVDSEEFKRALRGDMEEWMLFLAPHQRQLVNRWYNGPARVKGVVGSGKTVVAVHRARFLAREALKRGGKVLFLTYGNRLPGVMAHLLRRLAGEGAPELQAVECCTVHSWCYNFLQRRGLTPVVDAQALPAIAEQAVAEVQSCYPNLSLWRYPVTFFRDEIAYAIKGRAVASREQYLALERSGRGTPLQESTRQVVWEVYERYQALLRAQGLWDFGDYILETLKELESAPVEMPYVSAVVDEIQDLTEATMRLIRRLVPPGPNDLFLVGDGLQRIYPGGYALSKLGIDITGRGTLLRQNYRNTHEILRAAHRVVAGLSFDDMDDQASEAPEPEFSVRQGQVPILRRFATPEDELCWAMEEIARLRTSNGYQDRDFVLLYRWRKPYQDLIETLLPSQFPEVQMVELQRDAETYFGPGVKYSTFDSAKGLEFKVVFVLGVTDGLCVPRDDWNLQGEELEDYLARERRRLYVAMTRARDFLYLTCSRGQPSRFLNSVPPEYLQRV